MTRTYRGYEIKRRVVRTAYARNGRDGKGTPTYSWDIYRDGKLLDRLTRLRDAKREIDNLEG